MSRKKRTHDLYFDGTNDAVNHSSQARLELGRVETDLNALVYGFEELKKRAEEFSPVKVGAMSTFSPAEDTSDPHEHLRIFRLRLRQVRANLASASEDIAELEQRYRHLLAE